MLVSSGFKMENFGRIFGWRSRALIMPSSFVMTILKRHLAARAALSGWRRAEGVLRLGFLTNALPPPDVHLRAAHSPAIAFAESMTLAPADGENKVHGFFFAKLDSLPDEESSDSAPRRRATIERPASVKDASTRSKSPLFFALFEP